MQTSLVSDAAEALAQGALLIAMTFALGLLPGAVVVTGFFRGPISLFKFLTMAISVSFIGWQAVTVVVVSLHWSALAGLWIHSLLVIVATLARVLYSGRPTLKIQMRGEDLGAAVIVGAVSLLMYVKGSAFYSAEEQFYVGIIWRMASVDALGFKNLYFLPEVFSVYPFSGHLFLQAIISKVAGLDPLFVFCKLRFFWAFISLGCVYVAVDYIFANARLALFSLFVAAVLAVNGNFADYLNWYWAQVLPLSHGADLAMGVVLPLLIVSILSVLEENPSAKYLRASIALGLIMVLTMIHVKSVLLVAVYLGAFWLWLMFTHRDQLTLRRRTRSLLLATLLIPLLYATLYRMTPSSVVGLEAQARQTTLNLMRSQSLRQWVNSFTAGPEGLYVGVSGIFLALSPLLLLLFPRKILVGLVAAGIFGYFCVIRFPFINLPYMYLTTSEAMQTPPRLFSFLLYLVPGPLLYGIGTAISRLSRPLSYGASVVISLGLGINSPADWAFSFWTAHNFAFYNGALVLFLVAWLFTKKWSPPQGSTPRAPSLALLATLVIPLAVISTKPERSPLALENLYTNVNPWPDKMAPVWRERDLDTQPACDLQPRPYSFNGTALVSTLCPPPRALITWVRENLPTDAILAVNVLNFYPLNLRLPQQTVGPPLLMTRNYSNFADLVPVYAKYLTDSLSKLGDQPFFNNREDDDQRRNFLHDLKVDYVVIDPSRPELRGRLGELSFLKMVYQQQNWAIFQVIN